MNFTGTVPLHTLSRPRLANRMRHDELTQELDVLVVDDEPTVRELLHEYFGAHGFRVTSALDGRSAITTLQKSWGRFGLVITDLNLPGADGFAVLQAARQVNPNCFVVIITGFASLDSAIRAVRVGAYDYLTKPFSLAQLDVILARIGDCRLARPGSAARPRVPAAPAAPAVAAPQQAQVPPPLAPAPEPRPATPPDARTRPADGMAPYNMAERLGLLEAAFGRIEALLREKR